MLRPGSKLLAVLSISLVTASSAALSPDPRLLRMVPPGTPLVAGFRQPTQDRAAKYYMIITRWNRADLDDFKALTGADQTRKIHEVMFVGGAVNAQGWGEHSVLIRGTFDPQVLRFADGVKVRRESYRDIPVLVVKPFERERSYLTEVRWLAVLDAHFAVFGTINTVKRLVNRDLDGSATDPNLMARLARLSQKDDTWSLITDTASVGAMIPAIDLLDPKLSQFVAACRSMQIGLEIGRRVRLEYEVVTDPMWEPARESGAAPMTPTIGHSLLGSAQDSQPTAIASETITRGVLKLSRESYERWLVDVDTLIRKRNSGI